MKYEYQNGIVSHHVQSIIAYESALDGSCTGAGKTYIAAKVAKELGMDPIVICPKAVLPAWAQAFRDVGVQGSGTNYEKLTRGKEHPWGEWRDAKSNSKRTKRFVWDLPGNNLIIFDEAHRCKGKNTLNGLLLYAATVQRIPRLMLSATAVSSPLDMKWIGSALGLFPVKNWWTWCCARGLRKSHFGHWEFDPKTAAGKKGLKRMHDEIFGAGRGARLTSEDIPGLPEVNNIASIHAFDDVIENDQALQRRIRLLQEMAEVAETTLEMILRELQAVELAKVTGLHEMTNDALREGHSVVIFVRFRDTLLALAERLRTKSIIAGGQSAEERAQVIEEFQADRQRVIVSMIQAGGCGISLHDTHGNYPRLSLICPPYSAVDLRQCMGRIHRAGSKSRATNRIVFAAGTQEQRAYEIVREKLNSIDQINDGDLQAGLVRSIREDRTLMQMHPVMKIRVGRATKQCCVCRKPIPKGERFLDAWGDQSQCLHGECETRFAMLNPDEAAQTP